MNTQSMVLAVIIGDSPGIGVAYSDRLGLNRRQNTSDSSSRKVLV
jgi:hypothetical protein